MLTVEEFIEKLQALNAPKAEVCLRPLNATSRQPTNPVVGEGYISSYGYMLDSSYFGFREAQAEGKTYPVVWI